MYLCCENVIEVTMFTLRIWPDNTSQYFSEDDYEHPHSWMSDDYIEVIFDEDKEDFPTYDELTQRLSEAQKGL
jgi:hypothetical protein